MRTENREWITGAELEVGDVMFCGGECRTITGFQEHPGLSLRGTHYTARIAMQGDWGITRFDDDVYRLCSDGVYCPTHLWFSRENKLEKRRK